MSESQISGNAGEVIVAGMLGYEGWQIVESQIETFGHAVDFLAKDPAGDEVLVEVKVWARGGGKDTVKKAIADAYDLREAGETRPYVLVLSHELIGLYADMLRRAIIAGVIARVRILGFKEFS
ncbi:MAG: hypothetical protein ABI862_14325 [Ilumatobacteraceae bacterium]